MPDWLSVWMTTYVVIAGLAMWLAWARGVLKTWRDFKDVILGALAITLIVAFLSGGRGCSQGETGDAPIECVPSGAGIYGC